ncbi:MAG: Ig-like domain-containing protein [Firmicutes bacterium]|nr:Ig-like domain-containing protein [Bacillota bacterium]
MKKMFRKLNSLVIAFAITASLFTAVPVHASAYMHQDEDASLDSRWTKVENYDDTHGNVYSFSAGAEYASSSWFTSEFEDGTYVVSMDFMTPAYPESGTQDIIMVDSEEWTDRTLLYLKTDGILAYEIRDAAGERQSYTYKWGTNYAANAWNNYSIVYEKSGTDVDVTQYVNGVKVKSSATRVYDNFRFKQIRVLTDASSSGIYLDNIVCKKISDGEQLNIDSITPIMREYSNYGVKSLRVKLNNILDKESVTSVQVVKQGASSNIVSSYRVVGQYIDVNVAGLEKNEGYTLTINQDAQSITGNILSTNTYTKTGTASAYLHKDEDASLDSRWTKVENYDAEHGNVYYFNATGSDHRGDDWFTEEFEDGTYVVSMDFKTPAYPAEGKQDIIMVDSEVPGSDRTLLYLKTDGILAYEIKDAEGDRQSYTYKWGTNYAANAWNNYSIMYEKRGTAVDVTQYVNGVAVKNSTTRISDNFRFRRITVYTDATSSGIYLDNIMCRKVSESTLDIEDIYPIYSTGTSERVKALAVKFTEPLNPDTVSDVSVVKTEDNLVSDYSIVGQYLYVKVDSLLKNDGFTFTIGDETEGISGNLIEETSFVKTAEVNSVPYMHEDYDADYDTTYPGKLTNYDAEHGDVYYFAASTSVYDGKRPLFEDEFADGTYVLSMDFKVNAYIQSGSNEQISIVPPTFANSIGLYLKTEGYVGVEIAGSTNTRWDRCYEPNAWNNYSVVFVKNGTNIDVTQYVNGISRKTGSITESAFRILRIMVYPGKNSTGLYLDNITCRKIEDSEKFAIENVTEIGNDSIQKIAVKFNQPIKPASVTSVSVIKEGTETNVVSSYTAVGQYMYINVSDIDEKDGYTIRFNNALLSVAGKGLASSSYKVAADNTETLAYWVCDGSFSDNIDSATLSGGANPTVSSIGGKSCCSVDNELLFTLSENIKPVAFDGSVYKFEIEYYDGASSEKNANNAANFFQLMYNQFATNDLNLDTVVYKNGTATWKTATITLNNANFYDSYSGDYDFKISVKGILPNYNTDKASANPVKIHSVRVTREVGKNPIFVTSATNVSGNSYAWYSRDKKITNTYRNVSDETKSVTAVTKLLDLSGAECLRYEENINIASGTSKASIVDFSSITECGIFKVCVDIVENDVTVSSFETGKVAILKTDPNGIKDKNIFLSVQGEAYPVSQSQVAADILDLMNVAGARVTLSWNQMLVKNSNDEYVLDWDSYKNKSLVTALREKGMTTFGLISGCPPTDKVPDSPGYLCLPVTQAQRNAFNEFIEYVGENVVKDGVSYIEFFNEPNLMSNAQNLQNASGTEYATMAISAKNALLTAATNAGVTDLKVAGPGVTGINQGESYTNSHLNLSEGAARGGYHYIQQAVENGFANNFDNVSFHSYTWDYAETIKASDMRKIQKLWTDRGLSKPNLWITEAGFYKGAAYAKTDWMQGAQNIRQIFAHKQNGVFGDVYSIYALERKGYNPAMMESNFGLINPLFSAMQIDGCYGLPTESALMLTAMNYIMPNAEFVSTDTIEAEYSDIVVSKFTSDKWDGKQIITAYNLDDTAETVSINLGVNKVKCFDEFGNETMLTSGNGIYNVEVDSAPIYFVADFDGEADSRVKISVVANGIEYGREEISANVIDFNNYTVKIDNFASLPNDFILITTFYKDGAVVAIKTKACQKNQIVDNKVTQVLSDIPEYDNVKITLWNNFVNLEPLCRMLEGK